MSFEPKAISRTSVPAALQKAERYRIINDPSSAESICLDVLAVDPDWMGRGLHQPGDEIAWSLRPEQAYALPPSAADELAAVDPDAVPVDPEASA